MKNTIKQLILFFVFTTLSSSLLANVLTIDAKTLSTELKTNKSVIIIDVQAADVYAKQHIQGAINIPHKSLYKDGPVEGQFKTSEELAAIFGEKGVSNTSKIILYDDGSQKYNSRVWWILKHLGATDVTLFHKENSQMESARIPMTATPTKLKATTFAVNVNHDMNIDMATLKSAVNDGGIVLLDNREQDEYNGVDKANKSKGHLPGAIFMNFKEILNANGSFKTKEEIIEVAAKFGATPDKNIVVYCQTGIKAAPVYVALKEIAGFDNVKLYAGAYAEWASINDNPIVK